MNLDEARQVKALAYVRGINDERERLRLLLHTEINILKGFPDDQDSKYQISTIRMVLDMIGRQI